VVTYLASLIVGPEYRRRGIARHLVTGLFRRTGAWRMDLLAEETAEGFYRTFAHRTKPGYRIYPPGAAPPAQLVFWTPPNVTVSPLTFCPMAKGKQVAPVLVVSPAAAPPMKKVTAPGPQFAGI